MSNDPPVNFDNLVKAPKKSNSEGYPYQLSSKDLMRNFVFATLQIDPDHIEDAKGLGGYPARKLKIFPPIPSEQSVLIARDGAPIWLSAPTAGTYVLGSVTGSMTWIATEECE